MSLLNLLQVLGSLTLVFTLTRCVESDVLRVV